MQPAPVSLQGKGEDKSGARATWKTLLPSPWAVSVSGVTRGLPSQRLHACAAGRQMGGNNRGDTSVLQSSLMLERLRVHPPLAAAAWHSPALSNGI